MEKWICLFTTMILSAWPVFSQVPRAEAFRVHKEPKVSGPAITSLLLHQTSLAWRQDEARRENLKNIKTEGELLALQHSTRSKLLNMIGGLPN